MIKGLKHMVGYGFNLVNVWGAQMTLQRGQLPKEGGDHLEYWETFAKSGITLCICSKFALPRTKLKFE